MLLNIGEREQEEDPDKDRKPRVKSLAPVLMADAATPVLSLRLSSHGLTVFSGKSSRQPLSSFPKRKCP